jgi:hypothetical protein
MKVASLFWLLLVALLPHSGRCQWVTPSGITNAISFAEIGSRLFAAGDSPEGGVFVSTDNGASWKPTGNAGLVAANGEAVGVSVLGANGTSLYAAAQPYGKGWGLHDKGVQEASSFPNSRGPS